MKRPPWGSPGTTQGSAHPTSYHHPEQPSPHLTQPRDTRVNKETPFQGIRLSVLSRNSPALHLHPPKPLLSPLLQRPQGTGTDWFSQGLIHRPSEALGLFCPVVFSGSSFSQPLASPTRHLRGPLGQAGLRFGEEGGPVRPALRSLAPTYSDSGSHLGLWNSSLPGKRNVTPERATLLRQVGR